MQLFGMTQNFLRSRAVLVAESGWSINHDARMIAQSLSCNHDVKVSISRYPYHLRERIIHFGSQFHWVKWHQFLPNRNKSYICNYFHGRPGFSEGMDDHINRFFSSCSRLRYVTASTLQNYHWLCNNIDSDKVVHIPIGVDTSIYKPASYNEKCYARHKLGIPYDAKVIGSFQKDDSGGTDSCAPKLIKGPDILCEALYKTRKDAPITVLLCGPSRNYVSTELSRMKIPFKYINVRDERMLPLCYKALDAYLISSRDEGGPKGLLEALACGIPTVSTPVGMANDIRSSNLAYLTTSENISSSELSTQILRILYRRSSQSYALQSHELMNKYYSWNSIAERYYKLYQAIDSEQ